MQKYSTLFTDIPYKAGTVNHVTKSETASITDISYKAGTVNYSTKNETANYLWPHGRSRDSDMKREERLRKR